MAKQLFSNISSAPLAVSIIPTDLTIQVGAGLGVLFPSPTAGNWFIGCLEDSGGNVEYFKCTARTGDLLTVQRGQEGSTAQSFTNTTTRVELRNTKGSMEQMLQRSGDTLGGDLELGGFTLSGPGALGSDVTIPRASVFPVGMIVLWSGVIGSIPAGWVLCDGANGTPDLRNRFVLGAGISAPGAFGGSFSFTADTTAAGSHSHTGTAAGTALTADQLPPHTHNVGYRGSSASTQGADTDFVTQQGDARLDGQVATSSVGSGNPHTHGLTINADGSHAHSVTVTTTPPYYALCYIMYTGG